MMSVMLPWTPESTVSVCVSPKVLYAEGGSGAQRVPQHQILQSGVLLVFRQTLTGKNLPPLHRQLL